MISLKYRKRGEGTYIRVFFTIYLLLLVTRLTFSIYSEVKAEWWFLPLFNVSTLGEFGFTYGKVVSLLLFVVLALLSYVFLNLAKVVDFLIDTQNELAVVTRPTKKEYLGASIAVLVMVIIMSVYLAVIDSFFTIIFFK